MECSPKRGAGLYTHAELGPALDPSFKFGLIGGPGYFNLPARGCSMVTK